MIKVESLSKAYGGTPALRGVSFTVRPGEVCGYLGPNGAGKSTTVKILTGLLRADGGRAVVAGFDVAEQPLEVKRRIGYVPETGAVYSTLSANEYLALVGALREMEPGQVAERARKMLELFGIADAADRRLDALSKGQRQRVVLSAALLPDPDVILFDEPLSGLDANAARTVRDVVRGLADRGKTVLYCSHVLDVVERLCDRVVILDRGAVVADGPTADLLGGGAGAPRQTLDAVFRALTTTEADREIAAAIVDVVDGGKRAPVGLSAGPDAADQPPADIMPAATNGRGGRRRAKGRSR